tara:strand:- start:1 stop:831 length:831 start_codon:yes stop_codon:yes gene_type:complete
MEEKIAELEEKVSRKKQLSKKEVEDVKSIAKIKQLSKKEFGKIKGIPELENQLKDLKKDFEEHTKASKVKIDTGVGILVDSKYDDFISEIKAELTERLEVKEMTINNKLKANLKEQKERFAEQYTNLTNEFHQKYKEKVKEELKKDIKEKFKQILERKLAIEKNKITDSLIKEHTKKLHDDRKKMIAKLESNYAVKGKKLEVVKEKMYNVLVSKLKDIRKESNNKVKEKEEELKSQFEKKYNKELKKAISIRVNTLEKKKVELEKDLIKHTKKLFD